MSLNPTIGQLKTDSDRAEWWLSVFGSLDVPLRSPVAYQMSVNDVINHYYQVDIAQLTPEQFEKICEYISEKFTTEIGVVRETLRANGGLPIRESEISNVMFDGRAFL